MNTEWNEQYIIVKLANKNPLHFNKIADDYRQ